METLVLERHFDAGHAAQEEYPLLPFQVPPGVGRMHLSYQVSNAVSADRAGWETGNIVDIGLFDPRGDTFPGGRGFRGWSGTSKKAIVISQDKSTPGYLPGPIQPGTWHVLLGLYQLDPRGCDVRIVIRLEPGASDGTVTLPYPFDRTAAASGPRWFRGDLHCHSDHSDGSAPLEDLAAAARAQGLDFLAVTEHNTVSHLPGLGRLSCPDLLLIPGVEISTYRGHANIWPITDWIEFRCSTDEQMQAVRETARQRGALFSINHPKDGGPPWGFGRFFEPDCVEVWGAPWFISNYQSLAVWDRLLREGQRVTAVGGSDKHQGPFTGELGWYELGTPTTWVWAPELSIPAIVEGLRMGRAFVSEGPAGPRVELSAQANGRTAMMGETLPVGTGRPVDLRCRVRGADGCLLRLVSARRVLEFGVEGDDFVHEFQVQADGDGYFRPEVIDPPEAPLEEEPAALLARALGNPVYLR